MMRVYLNVDCFFFSKDYLGEQTESEIYLSSYFALTFSDVQW